MTFYETRPHIKNGKPISYANITVLTLRSKIKGHTEVKDVHNYSIIAIHSCAKFGVPVSYSKDDLAQKQIHGEIIILILRPRSRSYRDHEVVRHIVSWCYTHVPDMV